MATVVTRNIMMDCPMHAKIVLLMMLTLSYVIACIPHRPAVRYESIPSTATGNHLQGRFIDLQARRFISFEALVDAVAQTQVIAVGEEHYHSDIQAFELQVLRALAKQRPHRLALSMEFLERDRQATVDAYLAQAINRKTLQQRLHASPAFMRDYFPLLRDARQLGIPVLAMNAPRRIARQVARQGWQKTRQELNAIERQYLPESLGPIPTAYRTYFLDAVAGAHPLTGEQAERFATASYLKDVTMAATLTTFMEQQPAFIILAIAGRFHVDYGIAIPALLRQSKPNIGMRRITVMAVAPKQMVDLHRLARDRLADYLHVVLSAPEVVGQSTSKPMTEGLP
jgi:uncharacterized iron-regulated protein